MTQAATATAPVYDTHAAIRRLTDAGMPEPHAEAVVREQTHLIEHNLATKFDIEVLRQDTKANIDAVSWRSASMLALLRQDTKFDIEVLRQETKASIDALRQDTKASIDALRQDTKANIEVLRQETRANIEAAKNGIIRWVLGLNVGMVGLMIAVVKLL